jgi:hypothetical protein
MRAVDTKEELTQRRQGAKEQWIERRAERKMGERKMNQEKEVKLATEIARVP